MSLLAMIPSEDEQIESIESIDHNITMNAEPTERSAFIVSQEELDNVLRRGSGFEDGKLRVAALYTNHPDAQTAQSFLKEEYGSGGHSLTYLDGTHGFVDYNARGMRLTRHGFAEDVRLRWPVVEQHIRRMVESGIYLYNAERQRFEEIQLAMAGHDLPMPIPRYAYEPHAPVEEASSPELPANDAAGDGPPLRPGEHRIPAHDGIPAMREIVVDLTGGHHIERSSEMPTDSETELSYPYHLSLDDTVYLDGHEYYVDDIFTHEVHLRDPNRPHAPIRAEGFEDLKNLLQNDSRNDQHRTEPIAYITTL